MLQAAADAARAPLPPAEVAGVKAPSPREAGGAAKARPRRAAADAARAPMHQVEVAGVKAPSHLAAGAAATE